MKKFEFVTARKIVFDKPILIIYNPSSGKSVDLVPQIKKRLEDEKILYELMPTKKAQDTYFFAKNADLSKFCMLVASGGDGSHHEVVNGMLARDDGVKVPVALIPNGSGNDCAHSLNIISVADALDAIVHGECVRSDTVRILLDREKFEDIKREDEKEMLMHCRHMITNTGLSVISNIVREAIKYKSCCGTNCYAVATMQEACLFRMTPYRYSVIMDGIK